MLLQSLQTKINSLFLYIIGLIDLAIRKNDNNRDQALIL